jgi:hypothetical protein
MTALIMASAVDSIDFIDSYSCRPCFCLYSGVTFLPLEYLLMFKCAVMNYHCNLMGQPLVVQYSYLVYTDMLNTV